MQDERYGRGAAKLRELYGDVGEGVLQGANDVAPDLHRYVVEFAFGDVYSRPGLSARDREIATIAALTVISYAPSELEAHVYGALNAGCTRNEILEVITQMTLYAGFPASLRGVEAANRIFARLDDPDDSLTLLACERK